MDRVLIATGATGGHLFPAISIAEGLKRELQGIEIVFAGEGRRGEDKKVERHGYRFERVPCAPLKRELALPLEFVIRNATGYFQARRLMRSFPPGLVVATGGYACGPVGLAAWRMRIPLLLQEQNCMPGLTSKLLARFASRVCLGFEPGACWFKEPDKIRLTGNPLRPELLVLDRGAALEFFGLEPDFQTVLVLGGSQGAKNLNTMIMEILEFIQERGGLQLVWQTGESDFDRCRERIKTWSFPYRLFKFIDNMSAAYSVADLVLCRSGALTLSELAFMGKPSLLVPYPSAAEGHQYHNARYFQNRGAAAVVLESEFKNLYFRAQFQKLVNNPKLLERMGSCARRLTSPQATSKVVAEARQLLNHRPLG